MQLIFLHGPPAVGKLTIGKVLAATTSLPLFHNHYVVDAVSAVFAFQTPSSRTLREGMWLMMFEEAARTSQSLIFTFAPETTISRGFIDETVRVVEAHGGHVRFVALICSEDEQARRMEAPSRRDFAKLQSASQLRELAAAGWLDFGPLPTELTLDTSLAPAEESARLIAEHLRPLKEQPMEQVRLGKTGLKVSRLCLGCMTYGSPAWRSWVLDQEASKPFFKSAVEKGITFFDTANVYSIGASEEVTGVWLREFARREEIVVATKVNGPMGKGANEKGLSRKSIMAQIDASLTRLGMDYVDLYQIHRFDYETPIEETLEALNDVVKAGKARYIGASSMYAWQFARMLAASDAHGWVRFVSMQPQLNLVYREEEREMLPLCRAEGIGVIPWSPLARGFLAGGRTAPKEGNTERARTDEFSPRLYFTEADQKVVETVSEIARDRGLSNMQIALAWVLRNKAVTAPIVGASKLGHIDDAVSALDVVLSDDEVKRLEANYGPKPVLDHA